MRTYLINILLIFLFLNACSSSKTSASIEQIQALEKIVADKQFRIESNFAHPQASIALNSLQNAGLIPPGSSASQISLIGNPNHLKISGDSISSYLPYFGERRQYAGYGGSDSAIELVGLISDFVVTKDENKNSYTLEFNAKSKTEPFRVYITLFPNLKSRMVLSGTTRQPIEYSGNVKAAD